MIQHPSAIFPESLGPTGILVKLWATPPPGFSTRVHLWLRKFLNRIFLKTFWACIDISSHHDRRSEEFEMFCQSMNLKFKLRIFINRTCENKKLLMEIQNRNRFWLFETWFFSSDPLDTFKILQGTSNSSSRTRQT